MAPAKRQRLRTQNLPRQEEGDEQQVVTRGVAREPLRRREPDPEPEGDDEHVDTSFAEPAKRAKSTKRDKPAKFAKSAKPAKRAAREEVEEDDEQQEARVPRPAMRHTRSDDRPVQREPLHTEARRTRRRKATEQEGMFDLPTDEIPSHLTYEWKRWSNVGLEDPYYIALQREQGWEPVSPKAHPTWVPPGYTQPHIIKNGQILMERPKELTEEARAEERTLAKRQMRDAEKRLGLTPKGELTREHPEVRPRITKEIGRMVPMAAD